MSRWRLVVLLILIAAPVLFLMAAGSYLLYRENLWIVLWWPLAACLCLAYILGWWWQRQARLLPEPDFSPPFRWTSQDKGAWQLIEARAKKVKDIEPTQLMEVQFYVDTGMEMAKELAHYYHPNAKDPVGSLTVPEILAVVELAAHDLSEMVDQYLPGGHLLTVDDWRRTTQIADWYARARNVYWMVSAVFSPIDTAIRFTAARLGLSRPLQMLQDNLLAWFFTAYVHRLGTYLIDLNSRRLRVGARRYRELMAQAQAADGGVVSGGEHEATDSHSPLTTHHSPTVTLTLMGQVKTGKSSIVNALLGERRAVTDVLPATNEITRYELKAKGIPGQLVLLDTVGYAHEGPREDQVRATEEALQQSDLALLVMHARDPARRPDAELLQRLERWFQSRPSLKMPPLLGVLTHIDLLSPAMEWSPPYTWLKPKRAKETSIHDAVAAAKEQLGRHLIGVVPVCAAEGKVYGVHEWLLPGIVELLGEARAVALLRVLEAEADIGKIRKVFSQLLEAGKGLFRVALRG